MATWIPNQPVFFGDSNQCDCDELEYTQLSDNTDTVEFQLRLSPCSDAVDIIPNGNFETSDDWTLGDNWTIADGQLCLSGDSEQFEVAIVGTSLTPFLFENLKYYQVNITVDSISTGGEVYVYLGVYQIGIIDAPGEYVFYGLADETSDYDFTTNNLVFNNNVAGIEICISSVTAFNIKQDFIVAVYDKDDNYIGQINNDDNPDVFDFWQDTVTITVMWSDFDAQDDCYYLCVLDPCNNTGGQNSPADISNPDFDDDSAWVLGGGWSIAGGVLSRSGPVFSNASQSDVFASFNNSYCVDIKVDAISGGITVLFGNNIVATITTTGVTRVCGAPTGTFDITIGVSVSGSSVSIDYIRPVTVDPADYTCNLQSNQFKLADYSNKCTLLLHGCNNEDGMGFSFTAGFSPRVRVIAKLRQAKYINERNIYEDSSGTKRNTFFKRRKTKTLAIDFQPEYIHDFISLLMGFDNFYINDVLYAVEDDEYNQEYSESLDNFSKANVLVSEKTQDVKNVNCSDDENVCTLSEDYLLQADDLGQFILLTDGEKIIVNA